MALTTLKDVENILRQVHDPEIPGVNIVDLGMVEAVSFTDAAISVALVPTFIGCPAQSIIAHRAVQSLRAHVKDSVRVKVVFSLSTPWTTARITDAGRTALIRSGIAPPGPSITDVACPFCGSKETVLENIFASASCRCLFYCSSCQNPFEAFKPI